jgi:hypothetical protein
MRSGDRFLRYLAIILVGVPIWFANAILVAFAPEFGVALGVTGPVSAGDAVMLFYSGLVVGDLASGLLSQALRSRRQVVLGFVTALSVAVALYLLLGRGASPQAFLALIGLLGLSSGYWAIFVTVGAEQFGTNIRATVATTVPNFVRGLVPVVTLAFKALKPDLGLPGAAALVGGITLAVAVLAAWRLQETFGKDLDYLER